MPNKTGGQYIGSGFVSDHHFKPHLITVAAVGFGSDGPYADKPAYDDSVQSVSGMTSLAIMQNPGNPPANAPTIIADKLGGITAAHAIMSSFPL